MGFFEKIKAGMAKTRAALSNTLGGVFTGFSEIDDDFYDELTECLILADLGVETAGKAVERLKKTVREQHLKQTAEAREALRQILTDMLNVGDPALNLSTQPSVILVIGVNGVGKTTTIGKIAKQQMEAGNRVLLVAADTFETAAPKMYEDAELRPLLPTLWQVKLGLEEKLHVDLGDWRSEADALADFKTFGIVANEGRAD